MAIDIFNTGIIAAYFILLFVIGYVLSKKETNEGFLIANRRVKWPTLAASISAGFVGGGFVAGVMAWAFLYGFSVMWIIVGIPIGFLLMVLFSKKLKNLSDKNKFYTLSDYIYFKFGKRVGFLSSIIIFLYFFAWLILQFVVGGLILSSITGLSYFFAILIIGIIILSYLMMAGFKAVIRTDFFQFILIFILLIFVTTIFSSGLTFESSQLNLIEGTGGPLYILGFLIIGIFVTMMSGDVWQRAYAAVDIKNLRLGLVGAGVIILVMGTIITLIGIIVRTNFPSIGSEEVIVYAFNQLLPPSLLWIGILILLSSIMSTADTLLFALSMNISRGFISRFKRLDEKSLVKSSRISLIVLAILSISVASLVTNVANLYLWLSVNLLIIAPAVLLSFVFNIKKNAAFISISLGFIVFLTLNILGMVNFNTAIIPFFTSLISLIIFSFFERNLNRIQAPLN